MHEIICIESLYFWFTWHFVFFSFFPVILGRSKKYPSLVFFWKCFMFNLHFYFNAQYSNYKEGNLLLLFFLYLDTFREINIASVYLKYCIFRAMLALWLSSVRRVCPCNHVEIMCGLSWVWDAVPALFDITPAVGLQQSGNHGKSFPKSISLAFFCYFNLNRLSVRLENQQDSSSCK